MTIALCGAQRVGKTTLAWKYSEKTGVPFVQTRTSEVLRERGIDPRRDTRMETRLEIQRVILDAMEAQFLDAPPMFIADRTPLDCAAYLLADVQRENVTPELSADIVSYVERCKTITNRHFGMIVLVQPGIPLVEEAGKAPAIPAHMEHLNAICLGLLSGEGLTTKHFYIPRSMTDLDSRVNAMWTAVGRVVSRYAVELQSGVAAGVMSIQ